MPGCPRPGSIHLPPQQRPQSNPRLVEEVTTFTLWTDLPNENGDMNLPRGIQHKHLQGMKPDIILSTTTVSAAPFAFFSFENMKKLEQHKEQSTARH
jgi:hypothetical protein